MAEAIEKAAAPLMPVPAFSDMGKAANDVSGWDQPDTMPEGLDQLTSVLRSSSTRTSTTPAKVCRATARVQEQETSTDNGSHHTATLDVKLKAPSGTNLTVKGKQGFDNVTSGSVRNPRHHPHDGTTLTLYVRSRQSTQSSPTVRKMMSPLLLHRPRPHLPPQNTRKIAFCNPHTSASPCWNCPRLYGRSSTFLRCTCTTVKSSH